MSTIYQAEKEQYRSHVHHESTENNESHFTELRNTSLFSLDIRYFQRRIPDGEEEHQLVSNQEGNPNEALPQYALLGLHIGDHPQIGKREPILMNTASPSSTFICGSQGSGKSYTLTSMLENYLLPDKDYGSVAKPVAGVAFHYDSNGSDSIAEVASLCSRGIKARVLASSSNFNSRCDHYMQHYPDAAENLQVQQIAFADAHLNIERMQKLMAFSDASADGGIPLYVSVINKILREMNKTSQASGGQPFTFSAFETQLRYDEKNFLGNQKNMLNLRLDILKSFMAKRTKTSPKKSTDIFDTQPGTLTIVDLTDPFVDPSTACILFDICLGLFKQNSPPDGMVVALDEAHRYMSASSSAPAATFTESLLTTIRLQRHTGTRVVIATQEPTISPRLMDLCSMTIVHHFNSPAWFAGIREHLAAASEAEGREMFGGIVGLGVGEALVFSPSAYVCFDSEGMRKLGVGWMKVKMRSRKGVDSGKSRMAGENDEVIEEDEGAPICEVVKGLKEIKMEGVGPAGRKWKPFG